MSWDEKARVYAAGSADTYALTKSRVDVFEDAARWQREALLTGETVERAARALVPQIWRLRDEGYESETHKQQVERSLLTARAALTAALGIEGDE